MILVRGEWEKPPDIGNYSCWGGNIEVQEMMKNRPVTDDVVRACVSLGLGLIVVISNSIFLLALNHKQHTKYLPTQPRYLLSSLAICELLKGAVVAPIGTYPHLFHCWPYPVYTCSIQALLVPYLLQQASLSLTLLAVDRYLCLLHPSSYHNFTSSTVKLLSIPYIFVFSLEIRIGTAMGRCVLTVLGSLQYHLYPSRNEDVVLMHEKFVMHPFLDGTEEILARSKRVYPLLYQFVFPMTILKFDNILMSAFVVILSWVVSSIFYLLLFGSAQHFYFNLDNGGCEVFPSSHHRLTIAACCLYFPTTMIMMYCYGTAFHMEGSTIHRLVGATVAAPRLVAGAKLPQKSGEDEHSYQIRVSHVMAVLSLSFIILITPWTLREIIAAATNYKMPYWLDYGIWIISETAGLFMLGVYWLLSPALRRATRHTLHNRICCGNILLDSWEENDKNQSLTEASQNLQLKKAQIDNDATRRTKPSIPKHQLNGKPEFNNACSKRQRNLPVEHEIAGEKLWGEILERAVSSTSLQNMNRLKNNQAKSLNEVLPQHPHNVPSYQYCNLHPERFRPA